MDTERRERQRQREREIETETQRLRDTERQTEAEREREIETEKQRLRDRGGQTDRGIERQTDRQKQRDREKKRERAVRFTPCTHRSRDPRPNKTTHSNLAKTASELIPTICHMLFCDSQTNRDFMCVDQ